MLGKLMKYEMKCCARSFVPLYIAILAFSIISGIFMGIEETYSYVIIYFLMFALGIGLFVATIVMTITVMIQRFNSNLLGDEGYLMFTLPVSETKLVLSKLLTSFVYLICTFLVVLISLMIFLGIFNVKFEMISFNYIWQIIKDMFSQIGGLWILSIISDLLGYINLILSIYLAITIGHISKFSSKKVLVAIIVFIAINIIDSVIFSGLAYFAGNTDPTYITAIESLVESQLMGEVQPATTDINVSLSGGNIVMIIEQILFCLALFFGTTKLLEKKLNLE